MTERASWDELWAWVDDGQGRLEQAVAGITDAQVHEPVRLEGWTRGHVLCHLARNADALQNLLSWASTGAETPMYSSPEARADGIEAGAARSQVEQLADLTESGARLRAASNELPLPRRSFEVLSAQGRRITALEVPWMRNREVWLHHVDLEVGFTMDDVPTDVATELVKDVAGWMTARVDDTLDLVFDGDETVRLGDPAATPSSTISGTAQQIAGWLTGRLGPSSLSATNGFRQLPPWL
jgi:maleylpyruvate isomerase